MLDALRARLRAFLTAGKDLPAPLTLGELNRRLVALEEAHSVREIQWAETRQALDRMLRRAAALQSREQQLEATNGGTGRQTKDQLRATLRAKGYLKGE
jgi:hypothetical protein